MPVYKVLEKSLLVDLVAPAADGNYKSAEQQKSVLLEHLMSALKAHSENIRRLSNKWGLSQAAAAAGKKPEDLVHKQNLMKDCFGG